MDGFVGFAEPHHDARLGLRAPGLRALEQFQRLVVPRLGPHGPVQVRHRLQVVVQQVGTGIEHGLERRLRSLEIGNEHFHAHARAPAAYGPDRLRKDRRAAVGPLVPVHRGNHGEPQAQFLHGTGHALGLVPVEPLVRSAGLHGAETAAARADIAQDHEGRRALLPALPDVGTLGALADRVQPVVPHQPLQFLEVRPLLQTHLEPRGLGHVGCGRFAHASTGTKSDPPAPRTVDPRRSGRHGCQVLYFLFVFRVTVEARPVVSSLIQASFRARRRPPGK